MECSVCTVRNSIGSCTECLSPVCQKCGRACAGCGRGFCVNHLNKLSSGEVFCGQCLNRQRGAGAAEDSTEARSGTGMSFAELQGGDEADTAGTGPGNEGLSFDALEEDLGDVAVATPEAPLAAEASREPSLKDQVANFDFDRPLLTASSQHAPPHFRNCVAMVAVGLALLLILYILPNLRSAMWPFGPERGEANKAMFAVGWGVVAVYFWIFGAILLSLKRMLAARKW